MDDKRIQQIRERCEAVLRGPWTYVRQKSRVYTTGGGVYLCTLSKGAVAVGDFIAAARQDVPDLLDALEAAQERIAALEAQIKAMREPYNI